MCRIPTMPERSPGERASWLHATVDPRPVCRSLHVSPPSDAELSRICSVARLEILPRHPYALPDPIATRQSAAYRARSWHGRSRDTRLQSFGRALWLGAPSADHLGPRRPSRRAARRLGSPVLGGIAPHWRSYARSVTCSRQRWCARAEARPSAHRSRPVKCGWPPGWFGRAAPRPWGTRRPG